MHKSSVEEQMAEHEAASARGRGRRDDALSVCERELANALQKAKDDEEAATKAAALTLNRAQLVIEQEKEKVTKLKNDAIELKNKYGKQTLEIDEYKTKLASAVSSHLSTTTNLER